MARRTSFHGLWPFLVVSFSFHLDLFFPGLWSRNSSFAVLGVHFYCCVRGWLLNVCHGCVFPGEDWISLWESSGVRIVHVDLEIEVTEEEYREWYIPRALRSFAILRPDLGVNQELAIVEREWIWQLLLCVSDVCFGVLECWSEAGDGRRR